MRMKKLAVRLLAGSLSVSVPVCADTLSLTPQEAVKRTLLQSPQLQHFPYQLKMADARQLQAGIVQNPELGVALENVLGTGDTSAVRAAELTISLSQLIELGDKRTRRMESVEWEKQKLQQQFELNRLDVVANTLQHYISVIRLQALIQWTEQRLLREQAAQKIAEKRSAAGLVSAADTSRLKLRIVRSELELQQLAALHQSALNQLAANWSTLPDFDKVSGDLNRIPQLPAFDDIKNTLHTAPAVAFFVTEQRLQESQLRLAQANRRADVTLEAGVRRNEDLNDYALVLGFSMPLSIKNSNAGNIQAAQVAIEAQKLQQQLHHTSLTLMVTELYQQTQRSIRYLDGLFNQLKPQALAVLTEIEQGYQRGQFDMTELLAAQQELLLIEQDVIETQVSIFLQVIELERLTGQPFVAEQSVAFLSQNSTHFQDKQHDSF